MFGLVWCWSLLSEGVRKRRAPEARRVERSSSATENTKKNHLYLDVPHDAKPYKIHFKIDSECQKGPPSILESLCCQTEMQHSHSLDWPPFHHCKFHSKYFLVGLRIHFLQPPPPKSRLTARSSPCSQPVTSRRGEIREGIEIRPAALKR